MRESAFHERNAFSMFWMVPGERSGSVRTGRTREVEAIATSVSGQSGEMPTGAVHVVTKLYQLLMTGQTLMIPYAANERDLGRGALKSKHTIVRF